MTAPLSLRATRHPQKQLNQRFEALYGIEHHKQMLLTSLKLIFQPERIDKWKAEHHPKGIPFFGDGLRQSPLILLSGDVGCGKTELAHAIGTRLSKEMGGETVVSFDTPSDVRGMGLVGEVSARITAAFSEAKQGLKKGEFGLLIIDEGDDLATSREQTQAHHEDRAGVNALIKEIDALERESVRLAILLITNRPAALDPAVLRRAATHLRFQRPDIAALKAIFSQASQGMKLSSEEIAQLVEACASKVPFFSYSDIFRRVARTAVLVAMDENQPLVGSHLLAAIEATTPSPSFQE